MTATTSRASSSSVKAPARLPTESPSAANPSSFDGTDLRRFSRSGSAVSTVRFEELPRLYNEFPSFSHASPKPRSKRVRTRKLS